MPAPWPYHIDDTTDIFGWPYALMPRLPGETFHHQQSELDWAAVGEALAQAAPRIALRQIPPRRCSQYHPNDGEKRRYRKSKAVPEYGLDRKQPELEKGARPLPGP